MQNYNNSSKTDLNGAYGDTWTWQCKSIILLQKTTMFMHSKRLLRWCHRLLSISYQAMVTTSALNSWRVLKKPENFKYGWVFNAMRTPNDASLQLETEQVKLFLCQKATKKYFSHDRHIFRIVLIYKNKNLPWNPLLSSRAAGVVRKQALLMVIIKIVSVLQKLRIIFIEPYKLSSQLLIYVSFGST